MPIDYLPKYKITDRLLGIISGTERIHAWLTTAKIDLPWLETVRFEALVKRAHFSTAIEGNPLTLSEVEALARGEKVPTQNKARREVLNYFAALRWIENRVPKRAISEKGLLTLHRLLMQGVLRNSEVGTYKRRQNFVVAKGRVIYTPPGPKKARGLTLALLRWLEGRGVSTHPIIAQAIAHYELIRIHPFIDGNGRCARCLATWVLYHRGFDTKHLFAVDQFYKEDHEGYYEAIQRVQKKKEELTSWLEYSALAVKDTLERTKRRIEELSLPAVARKVALTRQQERLLLAMKESAGLSILEMTKIIGVKKARLYRILKPLLENGIIQATETRPVVYRIRPSRGRF